MFDIGFAELLLVAIIGLLVLGPDRLPVAVRTIALWVGRIRRNFRQIQRDIEREIGADEIRQQLHNESIMQELNAGKRQLEDLHQDLKDLDQATFQAPTQIRNDPRPSPLKPAERAQDHQASGTAATTAPTTEAPTTVSSLAAERPDSEHKPEQKSEPE